MSDVGWFGEPLDPGFLQAGASEFTELVQFVWVTAWLVNVTLEDLQSLDHLDDGIRRTIPGLQAALPRRVLEVIGQILGGEHADALRGHGLADNDPEWAFKAAVFYAGLNEAQAARTDRDDEPGALVGWLKKARHPLRAANVILRSIAGALPGGSAFNEIKDGVEAVVEKATEDDK